VRRKTIGCLIVGVVLVLGFVLVRRAARTPVEELAERPGIGRRWSDDRGPIAYDNRFLAWDGPGSRLQFLDEALNVVDSIPAPKDVDRLSASRDLSIVAALEYRLLCVINTRTKVRKDIPLEEMSTELFLSPDAAHLWVGEYQSGRIHHYSLKDVEAQRLGSADVRAEAARLLGPPRLIGIQNFRIAAAVGLTTYLHCERFNALLIYDWAAGKAVGQIPLPGLNSHPTFVQSPAGDRLAIVANHLVIVDLPTNSVVTDVDLDDSPKAGDFNAAGDRFYVGHRGPDMFALPLTHRGGQVDEFDLQGNRLRTWRSKATWIWKLGCRGPVTWMVVDDGTLRTIRMP
jgi:hypothetical protein